MAARISVLLGASGRGAGERGSGARRSGHQEVAAPDAGRADERARRADRQGMPPSPAREAAKSCI